MRFILLKKSALQAVAARSRIFETRSLEEPNTEAPKGRRGESFWEGASQTRLTNQGVQKIAVSFSAKFGAPL